MLRFATRLSILLVLLACTVCGAIGHYRYSGPPYDAIDRHALAAPAEVGRDLDSLAAYLAAGARTDREKARAIYIWIIDRITYDEAALKDGSGTAEYALRSRRVVCRGYANLFRALAGRMGLESTVVRGWAKSGLDLERHAWNAVCIDGNWQLVDSTWGDCDGERTASREAIDYCANFYFLTPPERLISSHFPYDSRWQCLAEPMKLDQFTAQPECDLAFYRAGLKPVSAPKSFEGPFQMVLEGPGDLVVDAKLGEERDDHSTMVTRR